MAVLAALIASGVAPAPNGLDLTTSLSYPPVRKFGSVSTASLTRYPADIDRVSREPGNERFSNG
jgi:hypothetical protein